MTRMKKVESNTPPRDPIVTASNPTTGLDSTKTEVSPQKPLPRKTNSEVIQSNNVNSNTLNIKYSLLDKKAKAPSYASSGAVGLDLTACSISTTGNYIEYDTGVAVEVPDGYVGLLFPRSSNSKKDLVLSNSVGVIDTDYRGSLRFRYKRVVKRADPTLQQDYSVGDKVGQLLVVPVAKVNMVESKLSNTDRGEKGFGSTGN